MVGERGCLYYRKSMVGLLKEHGYIARRLRFYYKKSVVIFPEEEGYIAGRGPLYCWKSVLKKIVAYLSCSAGHIHFAQTNYCIIVTSICVWMLKTWGENGIAFALKFVSKLYKFNLSEWYVLMPHSEAPYPWLVNVSNFCLFYLAVMILKPGADEIIK